MPKTRETTGARPRRRTLQVTALAIVALFILMQFARFVVPAFKISNPPVQRPLQWDSARTETLWNIACRDCHSNETVWPWYAYIAPFGWLAAFDVNQGRDEVNLSEGEFDLAEMIEAIFEGKMPPAQYLIIHTDAKLSDVDKQALVNGLLASLPSNNGDDSEEHDDD